MSEKIWEYTVKKKPMLLLEVKYGEKTYKVFEQQMREILDKQKWIGSYAWLPEEEYEGFLKNVAKALGMHYSPSMLEYMKSEHIYHKRYFVLPEKGEWQKGIEEMEKQVKDVAGMEARVMRQIANLEGIMRLKERVKG